MGDRPWAYNTYYTVSDRVHCQLNRVDPLVNRRPLTFNFHMMAAAVPVEKHEKDVMNKHLML